VAVLFFQAWSTWPLVVFLSDVAQLLPLAFADPYVPRVEQIIVCSVVGLGLALVLGLTSY
jgi:hydrogenase/urease accessory protein HupE